MKTNELTGLCLDWAVAKALGLAYRYDEKYGSMCFRPSTTKGVVAWDCSPLSYSTDWAHGGPVIEQEQIELCPPVHGDFTDKTWMGVCVLGEAEAVGRISMGDTPLIAAMRCFVASKLGDEVEIPKEVWPAFLNT